MRCDEAQRELLAGRAAVSSDELDRHVRECAECSALAGEERALDTLLALDQPHRPGPGFDTRFFARLDDERTANEKKRALFSMRMWLWALVPVAAGVALLIVPKVDKPPAAAPPEAHAPPALMEALSGAEPDDLALASDLELLEDIDVVQRLEELEDFELLGDLDHAELDRLAAEEAAP
jgi:hypothetical protein